MLKKYLTVKWLLRLALPVLVLAGALFFTHTYPFSRSADKLTPGQKQEAQFNTDNKKSFIENGGSASSNSPEANSTNSANNAATPSDSNSIQLSARQEANNSVTVFTKLYGYSSGSCELKVTNGQSTESQTADIIYQSQFSTCAGFSVPIGKLGSGTWNIKLTVTSEGSVKNGSISFEVK